MKRLRCAIELIALSALCFGTLFVLLQERIFLPTGVGPGKELRTVLAIRDPEGPFAQWASYVFTRGYFNRYYSGAQYFTQSKKDDCKQEFISSLDAALTKYQVVDVYLLAHTNNYIEWVKEVPEEHRKNLRFVYNTGCYNLKQGPEWLKTGAKAYIGHPGNSASEIFYFYFLRRWARNYTLSDALDEANLHMENSVRTWELLASFRERKLTSIPSTVRELFSGSWNAASILQQSRAVCYGDGQMRIGS
jgi:ActR/RegA family two-component response regulator